jgi:hypothetical protein
MSKVYAAPCIPRKSVQPYGYVPHMDLAEALRGSTAPAEVLARLVLIDITHLDDTGTDRGGQLVVHEAVAEELVTLFAALRELGFPLTAAVPIAAHGWDDEASMAADNTSAFCWRPVAGSRQTSWHSYGVALDLNPARNPYGDDPATWRPPGSRYDATRPGTLAEGNPVGREVVRRFETAGWTWLGRRDVARDRHHFHKPSVLEGP